MMYSSRNDDSTISLKQAACRERTLCNSEIGLNARRVSGTFVPGDRSVEASKSFIPLNERRAVFVE